MNNITVDDMKALQNNNYNVFAEEARPILLNYIDRSSLSTEERKYLNFVEQWDLNNNANDKGVVCFIAWWDSLHANVFNDDLIRDKIPVIKPEKFVLLEALKRDSSFKFIDDINTPEKEDLVTQVTSALKKASLALMELEKNNKLEWGKYKNTTVYHLLKNNAMPFARTGIFTGGGNGIINATQHDHGPSWKMIIEMTTPTNAYGVYPGGQSGNPGSFYYDNFIDTWSVGEYYKLWFMGTTDITDNRIKWKMSFKPA